MSKPIGSYPKVDQGKVIARRLAGTARGLGYLAAVDAQRKSTKVPSTKETK